MLDKYTIMHFDDLFTINELRPLPYEHPNNIWMAITFEMDLDVLQIERNVYTTFDMLSDVGGLTGIIYLIFQVLANLWNFQSFDNFMVSRLFKIKKAAEEISHKDAYFSKSRYIKQSSLPEVKAAFFSVMPSCFQKSRCCRQSRKEKAMQMAR